jgi:hypothetical protein
MMRVEMRVGRLLEVRASLPIQLEEIPALTESIAAIFRRAPARVVAILDARTYGLEPPEATEHFIETMKRDNARVERSAFVVEPHQSLLALQLDRMIRDAGNPDRRLFRGALAATAFLRPVLSAEESARLDAFLAVDESAGAEEPVERVSRHSVW